MGVYSDLISFRMEKPLAQAGVTSKYLAKKLKAELEAKETKFFQHEGEVTAKRNVIAWSVRQRARQDAHKLRGDYPAEKVEHSGTVLHDLPERLTKAIEATIDAIRGNGGKPPGKPKGKKRK